MVGGEVRIDGDPEQAALGVGAEAAARGEIERGRGEERATGIDAQLPQLRGSEHPPIGRKSERGRRGDRGHEIVLEADIEGGGTRWHDREYREKPTHDEHEREDGTCGTRHGPLLPGARVLPVQSVWQLCLCDSLGSLHYGRRDTAE